MDNNKRIRRKVRNAYVISTVSIALVLFLLGSVGYLILGAMGATQRLEESMTVYVMLRDDVTPEASEALSKKLSANEAVREVHFIGKDAAAEEFKEYLGDDFVEFLEQNPLPDSYELRLNAGASDKETISALEKEVSQWEGVAEVVYQRGVLEQIGQNINKFNMILLLFGGTLLIIALILLNNTIRVTIFSKRYIINTMKLVGATKWFIMRPFLSRSILQGIYAGLIAWAMLIVMMMGLHEGLPEIKFVSDDNYLALTFAGTMAGGVLISLLFTAFAVRKFLRMSSSKIHIY